MVSVAAEPASPSSAARRATGTISAVALAILVADQLTKWWAIELLTEPSRTIDLVGTLRLNLLYNRGTAFSLTDDSGPIVTVIAIGVVAFLVWNGRRHERMAVHLAYGSIIGGTVGNLVDRAFRDGEGFLRGGVVDFVDLQWFPVFNLADAALVIGVGVVLLLGFTTDAFDERPATEDATRTEEP